MSVSGNVATESKKTASKIGLAFLCGFVFLSTGCAWIWFEEWVDPKYDARGEKVLLIQFKEDTNWYGESGIGRELYRQVYLGMQECEDTLMVTDERVEEGIYECLEENPPWGEFGRAAGADLIVFGTIHKLQYKDPRYIGMFMGALEMTVEVVDVETGNIEFRHRIEVSYGADPEQGRIEISLEHNKPQVRAHLFRKASERVVALLCGEIVDKR